MDDAMLSSKMFFDMRKVFEAQKFCLHTEQASLSRGTGRRLTQPLIRCHRTVKFALLDSLMNWSRCERCSKVIVLSWWDAGIVMDDAIVARDLLCGWIWIFWIVGGWCAKVGKCRYLTKSREPTGPVEVAKLIVRKYASRSGMLS